jgi:cell division protein FtsN
VSKSESTAKAPAANEPAGTASRPRGIWTIQLAAYNTRPDAEQLVRKLAARGVKARISGDAKPFRVRLDYYQTREEAAARVAELKQRGIIGFVTDEPRATGAARP